MGPNIGPKPGRLRDTVMALLVEHYLNIPFLARLHFSAEELLLYPRRQRPRRRPQNVRANVKVLEGSLTIRPFSSSRLKNILVNSSTFAFLLNFSFIKYRNNQSFGF